MNQIFVKMLKNYKPAFFILFVILGMQTLGATAQTAPARLAQPEPATEAKRVLTGIEARNFARIKDARMRKAIQQSYKALKAIADNKSKDREARLMDEFERTVKDLKAMPQGGGANLQECDDAYARCMEICKEIGSNCKLCGIGQNGCYLNKLAIEMTKNPNLP